MLPLPARPVPHAWLPEMTASSTEQFLIAPCSSQATRAAVPLVADHPRVPSLTFRTSRSHSETGDEIRSCPCNGSW
jgi:hypothetical protein